MDEKSFYKILENKEKRLYENIFLTNTRVEEVLKQGLKKYIKYIIVSNIGFSIMHNCFIKAMEDGLYKENLCELNRNIVKICIYFEEILKIIDEILLSKE